MRWIVLVLTLISMTFTPVLAQEDMTTRELKALSPRAANRKAQQDLLSIFEPVKKYESGMFRNVHGVEFTTLANGTEFEGLCSRDYVTLWYAPTKEGQTTEDTPVRPYKVSAFPEFHFLKLPVHEPVATGSSSTVWQDGCTAAGNDDRANWFTAMDARTAVQGALVYEAALQAIKSGVIVPTCEFELENDKCVTWVNEHNNSSNLPDVQICPHDAGTICYILGGLNLTIKARINGDSLTPGAILSVTAVDNIVVT